MAADRGDASPRPSEKLTSNNAEEALSIACETAGLDSHGAQLLRLGTNANYRLAKQPILVRIASGRMEEVRKEIAVARWLACNDFPSARIDERIEQPLLLPGGQAATFWELIEEGQEPVRVADVARLLRGLHHLPEPEGFMLPLFDPLEHTARRLESAPDSEETRFLRDRCETLRKQFTGLNFVLPQGVLHGDAHEGNALRDRDGTVRLLDFEAFAWGPREWDVGVVAMRYQPFGWMSEADYRACVLAYDGFDIIKWPGYPVLTSIRELNMTSWLLHKVGESPEHNAEFRKRMTDLNDNNAPRRWCAF